MKAASMETRETKMGQAKIVTFEVRPDGVGLVTLNDTSETFNTITERFGNELVEALDRVESDPAVRAAVIVSGKKDSFVVGANIDMIRSIKLASEAEALARKLATRLSAIKPPGALRRPRRGEKPIVCAVHGQALGGGFEIALACHAIVASDDKKTTFGLPEVQLGLVPAANGMLRIAERAGLEVALDLSLTGKNTRAAKAKKLGLVDEVCPTPLLLDVAVKKALELAASAGEPAAKKKLKLDVETLQKLALEGNPAGRRLLFKKAREATRKKTRGHYPATERILDVLERFGEKGFAAAADLEAKAFGELVVSETAARLIEIFFATTALKKDSGTSDPKARARTVEHVAMVGGGLMGGGIAYVTTQNAGLPVRLKDKDDLGVGRGLKYVKDLLDERVKKRQLTREERDQVFARLTGTADMSGLAHADVVIEAVFEDLALKHQVLRDVEAVTKDTCIFASNTSSIAIGKIAEASKRPETVVGMHYFSPVHKMPLLEIIETEKTASWVVATAAALGKKQGKTVIVVKDGVGFYTSRILAPYMNEAAYLLAEGVPVETIDKALVDWGWPVGPITLLDEVGIDVAAHVGPILVDAFGPRLTPPDVMKKLLADDRKGRKNGKGFYLYGKEAKKKLVDTSVYATLGLDPKGSKKKVAVEELQMRCSLQMVNEALRCYGEGILRTPRDGDIGAIFGLGFPPFRGGPFRYVDSVGAGEILKRVRGYEDRFGARWEPAPMLVELAATGKRFHAD